METIPEILTNLQERKSENDNVRSTLNDISTEDVKELDDKINWHTKVINYSIYFLVLWLLFLSTCVVSIYFRLDDRIINETHLFNQRIDEGQRYANQRLDECLGLNKEVLKTISNSVNSVNPPK